MIPFIKESAQTPSIHFKYEIKKKPPKKSRKKALAAQRCKPQAKAYMWLRLATNLQDLQTQTQYEVLSLPYVDRQTNRYK